ncbi:MAG: SlyX family protein [Sphaerochaetaceae bacterium]
MEDRMVQVEMKLAFMEDTVGILNALVTQQRKEIDLLQKTLMQLEGRLAEVAEIAGDGSRPNRRPPHY